MTIASRYIMFQFLRLVAMAQFGALTLFLLAETIERIDDLVEKKAAISDALLFFAFKTPQIIFVSLPLAVLLACTLSLLFLSRSNEIVALRACGASIYRIVAPILIAVFLIGGASFLANEYIVPYTNRQMNHIWDVRIKKIPPRGYNRTDKVWFRSENNTIWNITHLDPFRDKLSGVTIFRLDENNRLVQQIDADYVEWNNEEKRWIFKQGLIYHFGQSGEFRQEQFQEAYFPILVRPADFKRTGKFPEEMNYVELTDYIRILQINGVDTTSYVVDKWGKLSSPLIVFVLALVGIPFSLRPNRSGGLALGVAMAIGIGAIYLVFFYAGLSLGHAGRLPPILAAWGPNALFLAMGCYMLMRVRG